MEMIISPENLYFLGKLMHGKTIDYDYVAAMDDISQKRAIYRQTCIAELSEQGFLSESFSGELRLDHDVEELLTPVFFCEYEASAEIYTVGEKPLRSILRFHWKDRICTAIIEQDGQYKIQAADDNFLRGFVFSLMPETYWTSQKPSDDIFPQLSLSRVFMFKAAKGADYSAINMYFDYSGWACMQQQDGSVNILSPKHFYDDVIRILKGGK